MKTILFADVTTIGVKTATGEVLESYTYSSRSEMRKYFWDIYKRYPTKHVEVTAPNGEKYNKSF